MVLFRAAKYFFRPAYPPNKHLFFCSTVLFYCGRRKKSTANDTLFFIFAEKTSKKIICNTLFFNAGDISHIIYLVSASISSVAKAFRSSPAVLPAENS